MNIPEAAVEAAAQATWDDVDYLQNYDYHKEVTAKALEAAAPLLMAQAWDEGAEAAWSSPYKEWDDPTTNPYRMNVGQMLFTEAAKAERRRLETEDGA